MEEKEWKKRDFVQQLYVNCSERPRFTAIQLYVNCIR